jgi:hypothetical protein
MMKHPLHGRMPVYSQTEIEVNKLAGWVVEEEAPEPAPVVAPEPEPVVKTARKGFFGLRDEDEGV